jgi:hypothetical protein
VRHTNSAEFTVSPVKVHTPSPPPEVNGVGPSLKVEKNGKSPDQKDTDEEEEKKRLAEWERMGRLLQSVEESGPVEEKKNGETPTETEPEMEKSAETEATQTIISVQESSKEGEEMSEEWKRLMAREGGKIVLRPNKSNEHIDSERKRSSRRSLVIPEVQADDIAGRRSSSDDEKESHQSGEVSFVEDEKEQGETQLRNRIRTTATTDGYVVCRKCANQCEAVERTTIESGTKAQLLLLSLFPLLAVLFTLLRPLLWLADASTLVWNRAVCYVTTSSSDTSLTETTASVTSTSSSPSNTSTTSSSNETDKDENASSSRC